MIRQLVAFGFVGAALSALYGLLYLLFRLELSAQWANAVALVLSTVVGTWGHRRISFGVRSAEGTVGHQTLGLALLVFGLGVTAGSLWLLDAATGEPTRMEELAVLVVANLGVGLVRFFAFRFAMFIRRP